MKLSVSGNLQERSNAEMKKAFGKGLGGKSPANPLTKMNKVRLASCRTDVIGSTKGPKTIGGVVGGLYDRDSYHGVKAGK
jgi:hypothetical protein